MDVGAFDGGSERPSLSQKRLYNSRVIDTFVKFVKKKYPSLDLDSLLQYADIKPYEVNDESVWLTQEQVDRFYYRLVEMTGNSNIAREAGRYNTSPETMGWVRQYAMGFVGPARAYEFFGKFAPHFTASSKYEAKHLNRRKVEITVTPYPGVVEQAYQCENRMGYFEALSSLYRCRFPKIEHDECIGKGGARCRYVITWKPSRSVFLRRVRLYVTVLLLLGVAVVFSQEGLHDGLAAATLSLSVLLAISYAANSVEIRELNESAENLRVSSEKLIEELKVNQNNALLVSELGLALTRAPDLDAALEEVVRHFERRLDFDRGIILLADQDRTTLQFKAGFGYSSMQYEALKASHFSLDRPSSRGAFVVAFKEQRSLLIDDIEEIRDEITRHSLEFARRMGVKSFVCSPITFESESYGIIAVDNVKTKRPLLQRDINLLVSIAAEVGILIHNSQLREQKRDLEDKSQGLERQLGQSRRVLADIMENASDGIIVTDRDGVILNANKAACMIYGFELSAFIGRRIDDFDVDPVGSARQRERILQGEPQVFEAVHYERGGKRIQIEVSAKAIDIEGTTYIHHFERDVTERKRMEALLLQSQKMESIGVLAGGIAHDLNNVITPVVSYSDVLLVKHSAELSDAVRDRIGLIQKAGERATGIIKKLLSFARISPSTMEQVNLNAVVRESMALLEQHMKRSGVRLNLILKEPLSLIAGAGTELQQVLMNLVVNAVDAMPDGGTLTVRTRDVTLTDEARRIHPMLVPGRYVVLSVTDTGHGIPKELRQKIFEPFFTTKGVGKGTGLGLAMSYSIIKEHRGVITVTSEPGRGATFEVYLPLGATGELALLDEVRRDSVLQTDTSRPDRVTSES